MIGVSRFSVSYYESGRNYPTFSICHKLCEVFHCSMDYLLGFSDIRKPIDTLSDDEHELLQNYEKLSSDDKKKVNEYIGFLFYLESKGKES